MEASDFYLTLPSNTKSDTGKANTTSDFTIRLPKTIDLPGEWVVALSEITYPYSWNNIGFNSPSDGTLVIRRFQGSEETTIRIPLKDYPDIKLLVATINQAVKAKGKTMPQMLEVDGALFDSMTHNGVRVQDHPAFQDRWKEVNPLKFVTFRYDLESKKVSIAVEKLVDYEYMAFLSPQLQYMLGFTTSERIKGFRPGTHVAPYMPDMTGGVASLYVYCDSCMPQVVGDTMAPLLRVVPIRMSSVQFGQPITEIFVLPHYIPVVSKALDTIQMSINTHTGQKMQFNFGNVLVKLHFKRRHLQLL